MNQRKRWGRSRRIATVLLFLTVVIALTGGIITYAAASFEQYIYDRAGILSNDNIRSLETKCRDISEQYSLNVFVLTTNTTAGKSSESYADDEYEKLAGDSSGVLLLVDMQNRMVWLSTTGDAIKTFSDSWINQTCDMVAPQLSNENYYAGAYSFLENVEGRLSEKRMQPLYYSIGALVIALVTGGIIVGMLSSRRGGTMTAGRRNYLAPGSVVINDREDVFTNTTFSRVRISNNSGGHSGGSAGGSSTHSSSGGISHGGGGRHF
jgi:uncharacterized protein